MYLASSSLGDVLLTNAQPAPPTAGRPCLSSGALAYCRSAAGKGSLAGSLARRAALLQSMHLRVYDRPEREEREFPVELA